jgi:hypothetical protein
MDFIENDSQLRDITDFSVDEHLPRATTDQGSNRFGDLFLD